MTTLLRSTALGLSLACLSTAALAQIPDDTLVQAWRFDDIISLDPAEMYEISTFEVAANVYDTLVRANIDNPADVSPWLAESWDVSDDGLTYTFNLRDDVTFASGNELTAEDVAYSFQRLVALDLGPSFLIRDLGFDETNMEETLVAVDDTTFEMTVGDSYAPSYVLAVLSGANFSIVDAELVESHAADGDWGNGWLDTNAAGSGAFVLDRMVPNEQIVMSRHEGYWAGDAILSRLIWRYVAESSTQRLLLEQGDVDIARNLSSDQLEPLRQNPDIELVQAPRSTQLYLGLNVANEYFADPRVREAMKYLVPYEDIVNSFLRDQWIVNQTFLPQGIFGFVDSQPYSYDPERARELLAEAGYADGFDLTVNVATRQERMDTAQAIQAALAEVNINLEIVPSDARTALGVYRAREHDIYLGTWAVDYFDPASNNSFVVNLDNSADAASNPLAWRNSWQNEELSQMALDLVLETDSAARAAGYAELIEAWQADSPFVMMFQQIDTAAVRTHVEGFRMGPTSDTTWYAGVSKG